VQVTGKVVEKKRGGGRGRGCISGLGGNVGKNSESGRGWRVRRAKKKLIGNV